jgi:hypothetical protein
MKHISKILFLCVLFFCGSPQKSNAQQSKIFSNDSLKWSASDLSPQRVQEFLAQYKNGPKFLLKTNDDNAFLTEPVLFDTLLAWASDPQMRNRNNQNSFWQSLFSSQLFRSFGGIFTGMFVLLFLLKYIPVFLIYLQKRNQRLKKDNYPDILDN